MQEVQNSILDLHKKMLALMEKKPLSDADKKALMDLKAQLDKLMAEHDQLMADLEKAFMDTKIFSKLTPEQQAKYMEMFRVFRDAQKGIKATNEKIFAFIREMNVHYGDLNNDGKIDRNDLLALVKYLLPSPPFLFKRPIYNKAADLDGDGRITWADYTLLSEAVSGIRKTFPVDPATKPGDLDGDGSFDLDDMTRLLKFVMNPFLQVGAWKKIADANGDGKINLADIDYLIKKIMEKPKIEPAEPEVGTATSSIGIATGAIPIATEAIPIVENASGATGSSTVQTGTPQASDSQSATGLNSSY